MLYIFWFLHQTTTHRKNGNDDAELYIFWFLHQTTTGKSINSRRAELYIFWFLHQTTTLLVSGLHFPGCISFDSYIKPQLLVSKLHKIAVVYLLIPTSNHNITQTDMFWRSVVYLLIPTSNHNFALSRTLKGRVVYLLIPTSNHNQTEAGVRGQRLYIFWFLHQTTTIKTLCCILESCISFDSYIKPQLVGYSNCPVGVVYLLIPTSNHNTSLFCPKITKLYIFWFLHQTTTYRFRSTDFQHITITFSNKKWWVGYYFLCKST